MIIKDLAAFNRKYVLSNGHAIQFNGQYATITPSDFLLLDQHRTSEFVDVSMGEALKLSADTKVRQAVETANAATALTANKVASQKGISPSTQALEDAEIAKANAALASNL